MTLGEQLKELRARSGFSQEQKLMTVITKRKLLS